MAVKVSNSTCTLYAFHLKYKLDICRRMYYSGIKFEVDMVNILLLMLMLREIGMGSFVCPSKDCNIDFESA